MTTPMAIRLHPLAPPAGARFDHMVRRFSRQPHLIFGLRRWGVDRDDATALVATVCDEVEVAPPAVTFHRGRGAHTGYYRSPRRIAVEVSSEARIRAWEEDRGRRWPLEGMIRLGEPAALGTVAHELAHHLTRRFEPVGTPNHGKRWVAWFDVAAGVLARHTRVGADDPGTSGMFAGG